MMNDFYYYNPVKVFFGREQLESKLAESIGVFGKKILLVYGGQSIKKCGIYGQIMDCLSGFEVFELSGVQPNPDVSSIREGARICKEEKVDVILAVGGGSVIDAAKWIAAAACVEFDAWDFFSKKTVIEAALPLITILTISATGSEMNNGGVISNRELCKKIGRSSPLLFPKVSFLNPEFTYSVGPYQTACGAVDIISHVMEVYFNRQDSLDMLNGIMESLIRTVIKYGKIAIDSPQNYEARANLMWAASWAINGFINGPVRQAWNCHTIEHELSARYGITHGHGLAIITPGWIEMCYSEEVAEVYTRFAENVLGIKDCENVAAAISERLSEIFFEEYGLASSLRELGIPHEDLKEIAATLCANGAVTGFKEFDENKVLQLLERCY